jgi:hypothetical protein
MTDFNKKLLDLLGAKESDVEVLGAWEPSAKAGGGEPGDGDVGDGEGALVPMAEVKRNPLALVDCAGPCRILPWDANLGLFTIELASDDVEVEPHPRCVVRGERTIDVDARTQDVLTELVWKGGRATAMLGRSGFQLVQLRDLETMEPDEPQKHPGEPVSLSFPKPDREALMPTGLVQPWLAALANKAFDEHSSPYEAAAAVGTVARLWSPPGASASLERVQGALLAGSGPAGAAFAWFDGLDASVRREIEGTAVFEADSLTEQVSVIERGLKNGWPEAEGAAIGWLHDRDDLESVMVLFEHAGAGQKIRRELDATDDEAALHAAMWMLVEGLAKDERLLDVSWQEPGAWWGGVVFGTRKRQGEGIVIVLSDVLRKRAAAETSTVNGPVKLAASSLESKGPLPVLDLGGGALLSLGHAADAFHLRITVPESDRVVEAPTLVVGDKAVEAVHEEGIHWRWSLGNVIPSEMVFRIVLDGEEISRTLRWGE